MNTKKLLSLWGLKWNPFSPELPSDGLLVTPRIESFAWRMEQLVQEGGFALICGESGTTLMTEQLMDVLVDHAAGNYRLLMTMSAELLASGCAHEVSQLDEKFYLELFQPKGPTSKKKARG